MKLAKLLSTSLLLAGLSATASAQTWGDYTLYSVQNTNTAYLIDMSGNTYRTYTCPTTAKTAYSSYLTEGGNLVRTVTHQNNVFMGGGGTGEVQIVDSNSNVLWDYTYSTTTYALHHDICLMPNGNILMISYELKAATDATAAGCSQSIAMWPDKIIEVQPVLTGTTTTTTSTTGNIVWEWHFWDHLVQSVDATKANYQTSVSAHPELMNINYNTTKDWLHCNGIDYNPALDQVCISSHNMNEIYVIDHSTTSAEAASHAGGNAGHGGDFLYRWGNPATYGATGTANFNVVHDAHWIPADCPKAGYLVGFNNNGVSMSQSAIDEVNPPLSGYNYTQTSGIWGPAARSYRLACTGHTSDMGNSQQLPNGNMLVCIAMSGSIYEVDSNGTQVWSKSVNGTIPQAFRYTACYVHGAPDTPTIAEASGVLTATATTATTYQWYLNGVAITGAISQTYTPATSGNYTVIATNSNGCTSPASVDYNYTSPTAISNVTTAVALTVYPNPVNDVVHLNGTLLAQNFTVSITDASGRLLQQAANSRTVDMSAYSAGIYYLSVKAGSNAVATRKLTIAR